MHSNKKSVTKDGRKRKPNPIIKNIGLDEKNEEANRLFKKLINPELLK